MSTSPASVGRAARTADRPLVAVVGAGLAMAAIYVALTLRMSLQEFFPGPGVSVDFTFMLGDDWQRNTVLLYGSFAGLFGLWGLAIAGVVRTAARGRTATIVVFGGPVLFVAVLASMYPPMAVDFFHNLADARLLWVHGENPMTSAPGQFFPIGISFGDEPSAYGPLWYLLLGPLGLPGLDADTTSLVVLKLWMGVFYLAATVLTWLIARRTTPGREALAVVLLAWNPFVVWRAVANGHNDVVMMTFLLAAVWLVVERRWTWVPMAFGAAVLVKYTVVLMAPAFAVYALRLPPDERPRALRHATVGIASAGLLSVAVLFPFWEGASTFDQLRDQADRIITSTPLLVEYGLADWVGWTASSAEATAQWGATAAFAIVAGVLFWRQRPGEASLIAIAALTMLAYTTVAVGWFRPWYFLWVAMLTPLLPGRWWIVLTICVSIGGMLPDVIEQYRGHVEQLSGHLFTQLALPVVAAFLPPVLAWIAALIATRSVDFDASRPTL